MNTEHELRVQYNTALNDITRTFADRHDAWERALEARHFGAASGARWADEPKNAAGHSADATPEWLEWSARRADAQVKFRRALEAEMIPIARERDAALARAKDRFESGIRACSRYPHLAGTAAMGSAGM